MTTKEKFDELRGDADGLFVMVWEWGTGRNYRNAYTRSLILTDTVRTNSVSYTGSLVGSRHAGRSFDDWSRCDDESYYSGDYCDGENVHHWHDTKLENGNFIRKESELKPMYLNSLIVDRFAGEIIRIDKTERELSFSPDEAIEYMYEHKNTPRVKYGLGKSSKGKKSLNDLRTATVEGFDGYWGEDCKGLIDLKRMFCIMQKKPLRKISKQVIKKSVARKFKRYHRKKKKITSSEQTFFRMLLGAGIERLLVK